MMGRELMLTCRSTNTLVFFTSDHGDYGGHPGISESAVDSFRRPGEVPLFCVGARVDGGRRIAAP